MMKIVGTVMMGISVLLIGVLNYEKYKLRCESIEWFIKLLSAYKFELKWTKKSIVEILRNFDKSKYADYIEETLLNISHYNLADSFISENTEFRIFKLNDDETSVLKFFFSESGKNNLETEISLCDKTLNLLEIRAKEANKEFKKTGPLSIKLGTICGIWILILLV